MMSDECFLTRTVTCMFFFHTLTNKNKLNYIMIGFTKQRVMIHTYRNEEKICFVPFSTKIGPNRRA